MASVLVIEDNPTNMKLARLILESGGHRVLTADTALTGIAAARSEQPDVILMDIQLPELDGFEATRRLKADAVTEHIPIIAVTAYAMTGDEARIRSAGCDEYVAKPYRRAELLDKVSLLLRDRAGVDPGA